MSRSRFVSAILAIAMVVGSFGIASAQQGYAEGPDGFTWVTSTGCHPETDDLKALDVGTQPFEALDTYGRFMFLEIPNPDPDYKQNGESVTHFDLLFYPGQKRQVNIVSDALILYFSPECRYFEDVIRVFIADHLVEHSLRGEVFGFYTLGAPEDNGPAWLEYVFQDIN